MVDEHSNTWDADDPNCVSDVFPSPKSQSAPLFSTRYEGSRRMDKFDVRAECAKGYKGEAKVEICSDAEEPYLLSGCGPKHCIEPTPRASKYYKLEVRKGNRHQRGS